MLDGFFSELVFDQIDGLMKFFLFKIGVGSRRKKGNLGDRFIDVGNLDSDQSNRFFSTS